MLECNHSKENTAKQKRGCIMDADKMTITLDTEDMRTVLASVGFVVCDWKEKARDEKAGKMAHESAVRNVEMWEAIYQNILQQMRNQGF
jgi:hypothetical protein